MDILVTIAYPCRMVARVITLLAILAITAVTTVTSAHAARIGMNSGVHHAMHGVEIMHSAVIAVHDCDAAEHCGSADAEKCAFVCAGLAPFLTPASGESGQAHGAARHDDRSEAIHVSRAPDLNERPPNLPLL